MSLLIQGTRISQTTAQMSSTYSTKNWSMTRWNINEGVGYPYLPVNGYDIIALPNHFGVNITNATAKLKATYTAKNWSFTRWDIVDGVSYPTLLLVGYDLIALPNKYGANITDIQSKTMATYTAKTWVFDANNWSIEEGVGRPYIVYYVAPSFALEIKIPTGVAHIKFDNTGTSPVKFVNGLGEVFLVSLVDVTDPKASPIRIKTSTGVKAFANI